MNVLLPHPDSNCPAVTGVEAAAVVLPDGGLRIDYRVAGDLGALRIPPTGLRRQRHGLWRHTCFEAFVRTDGEPAYLEFNFSPSGEWAAYTFRNYRQGCLLDLDFPPDTECETGPGGLRLSAVLAGEYLPRADRLRLALAAVAECADGTLGYWALRHPPGKPDFHHADAFTLELARP